MNDETIEKVIQDYENKLRENNQTFKLSEFEKLLLKQGIMFGYEYKENENNVERVK